MVRKVLQWPFPGNNGLNKKPKHGEHCKSSILELLHFKLSKSLGILSKTQWVETSTGVKWVNHLTKWSTGNTVTLDSSHQDNLCSPDCEDALGMDQAGITQVVKAALAEDLGSGLEPHSLTKLDAIAGQKLREDAPKSSKHSPSRVDHFQLPDGDSPENGPKYLTRSGPYHGLPDETGLVAVFLMETRPLPRSSEADGAALTAFPEKDGEERVMVEEAIAGLMSTAKPKFLTRFSTRAKLHLYCRFVANLEHTESFFETFFHTQVYR
ncbi:hypothetical protein RJ640_013393 [Escallonia rubra]|uniref:Uncharacterized protein n=1 Tax=Escallonia rubra TaxID=112253 RepID=A0AA88U6E6_9ASTE|nr:hypothetical protein RJ640_013393 [Escallonia rubra]